MSADGGDAQEQAFRDLTCTQAVVEELQHLVFAGAEPLKTMSPTLASRFDGAVDRPETISLSGMHHLSARYNVDQQI